MGHNPGHRLALVKQIRIYNLNEEFLVTKLVLVSDNLACFSKRFKELFSTNKNKYMRPSFFDVVGLAPPPPPIDDAFCHTEKRKTK